MFVFSLSEYSFSSQWCPSLSLDRIKTSGQHHVVDAKTVSWKKVQWQPQSSPILLCHFRSVIRNFSKFLTSKLSPGIKNHASCLNVECPSQAQTLYLPRGHSKLTHDFFGGFRFAGSHLACARQALWVCSLSFERHSSCLDKLWFDFFGTTSAALL